LHKLKGISMSDRRRQTAVFWLMLVLAWVPLRLSSAADTTAATNLNPSRDVEFTLKSADRKALRAGIKLHLFNETGEIFSPHEGLILDAGGTVKIMRLMPGLYSLWVEPAGDVPGKIFPGLEVKEGTQPQTFNLTVPATATLRGRLTLPDQKTPAVGYIVGVQSGTYPRAGGKNRSPGYARGAQESYAQTTVAPDGAWTLTGVTPGNYQLDIRKPNTSVPFATIAAPNVRAGSVNDIGTHAMPRNGWQWLFGGTLQRGGKASDFPGKGEMKIERDTLILGSGNDLTGVTWTQDIPRSDYEISFDAMRARGNDFFCGLTFPVGESALSFIVGGWGGTVVGMSSIGGYSAEENETTQVRTFQTGRWYRVRVRVTGPKIEAWIDDEKLVNLLTRNKGLSIRLTVAPSQPLGIATWRTTGHLRDVRLRQLDASEVATIAKVADIEQLVDVF
jgi:hypothetical protein